MMAFHARGRWGGDERNPPVERLRALLQELDIRIEDGEHDSVSLRHETEWCLGAYLSGRCGRTSRPKTPNPKYMNGVPREKVLALWLKLAEGDIAAVEAEPGCRGMALECRRRLRANGLLVSPRPKHRVLFDRHFCAIAEG